MSGVRYEVDGDVATVTIDRPEKHNALDWGVLSGLVDAQKRAARDKRLRAVVLRGAGPSFSSGLDFPSFTKQPLRILRAFFKLDPTAANLFQEAAMGFRSLPLPVVAMLHGRCYGGGLQIALGADFRIAAPDLEMSILEAKWGLVPDMSGMVTLRELMPIDQAKRLTMTGTPIGADRALALHLVTEVSAEPEAALAVLLDELRGRSPDSVGATKALFHATWNASEGEALARESLVQLGLLTGQNQRIAMKANFAKQPPRFLPRR